MALRECFAVLVVPGLFAGAVLAAEETLPDPMIVAAGVSADDADSTGLFLGLDWGVTESTWLNAGLGYTDSGNVDISTVNELFILTQPAHLQRLEKRDLDPGERDATRAEFIRKQLGI